MRHMAGSKSRRFAATVAALAIAAGGSIALSPAASAAPSYTLPQNITCKTKSCKDAKAWYTDYMGYATTYLLAPLGAESLHHMRIMTAMVIGGASEGNGGTQRKANVDASLVRLSYSKTGRACAARSLYAAGDRARLTSNIVSDARKVFSAMKKITKRYPAMKAYATVGYKGVSVANGVGQLAILRELEANLAIC